MLHLGTVDLHLSSASVSIICVHMSADASSDASDDEVDEEEEQEMASCSEGGQDDSPEQSSLQPAAYADLLAEGQAVARHWCNKLKLSSRPDPSIERKIHGVYQI